MERSFNRSTWRMCHCQFVTLHWSTFVFYIISMIAAGDLDTVKIALSCHLNGRGSIDVTLGVTWLLTGQLHTRRNRTDVDWPPAVTWPHTMAGRQGVAANRSGTERHLGRPCEDVITTYETVVYWRSRTECRKAVELNEDLVDFLRLPDDQRNALTHLKVRCNARCMILYFTVNQLTVVTLAHLLHCPLHSWIISVAAGCSVLTRWTSDVCPLRSVHLQTTLHVRNHARWYSNWPERQPESLQRAGWCAKLNSGCFRLNCDWPFCVFAVEPNYHRVKVWRL